MSELTEWLVSMGVVLMGADEHDESDFGGRRREADGVAAWRDAAARQRRERRVVEVVSAAIAAVEHLFRSHTTHHDVFAPETVAQLGQ